MGVENFTSQPVKLEKRESAEILADIEAAKVAAESLRALEQDNVVLKSKSEAQPYIDAYKDSLDALSDLENLDEIMIENNLNVFPGSSRLH